MTQCGTVGTYPLIDYFSKNHRLGPGKLCKEWPIREWTGNPCGKRNISDSKVHSQSMKLYTRPSDLSHNVYLKPHYKSSLELLLIANKTLLQIIRNAAGTTNQPKDISTICVAHALPKIIWSTFMGAAPAPSLPGQRWLHPQGVSNF